MTQPARTSVTANPINITGMNVDDSAPEQLAVTWEYTGTAPSGGWLLMYQLDGQLHAPTWSNAPQPTAVISPPHPQRQVPVHHSGGGRHLHFRKRQDPDHPQCQRV